jgi:hypothetical protein
VLGMVKLGVWDNGVLLELFFLKKKNTLGIGYFVLWDLFSATCG